MKYRKYLTILIPFIAVLFIVLISSKDNSNTREKEDNTEEISVPDSFLALEFVENPETVEGRIAELTTTTRLPGDENGESVETGDSLKVFYRGWEAQTGVVFDESFNHDIYTYGFPFIAGKGVIQGWSEGVIGMKEGEVRRVYIPSSLAYDFDPTSPLNGKDLIFDIELISIDKAL
ncbi:MAG: FKBP-type peptidyl-prolyl cis-trans isomerase [Candidatus Dojkabacteria bacterium]|nr:FKBP-type peptidyl-prolyl cis-trans isomerase [Candidatus Dojkabacteria bacterium]